jgi:hypothetical protein
MILKYRNNQQIHLNIYDTFYSQYSHQHVSAGIPAIFRVMFLLQKYNWGLIKIILIITKWWWHS